eukprot:m.1279186 g.1279186  ORF g.1279186 m.1279186 type:complete len:162 (+) comp24767_c0_seq10:381-866(+)
MVILCVFPTDHRDSAGKECCFAVVTSCVASSSNTTSGAGPEGSWIWMRVPGNGSMACACWVVGVYRSPIHNGERDQSLRQPTCRLGETQWHGCNYEFLTHVAVRMASDGRGAVLGSSGSCRCFTTLKHYLQRMSLVVWYFIKITKQHDLFVGFHDGFFDPI